MQGSSSTPFFSTIFIRGPPYQKNKCEITGKLPPIFLRMRSQAESSSASAASAAGPLSASRSCAPRLGEAPEALKRPRAPSCGQGTQVLTGGGGGGNPRGNPRGDHGKHDKSRRQPENPGSPRENTRYWPRAKAKKGWKLRKSTNKEKEANQHGNQGKLRNRGLTRSWLKERVLELWNSAKLLTTSQSFFGQKSKSFQLGKNKSRE